MEQLLSQVKLLREAIEILSLQEAAIHLKHALELKPGFEPALRALKEIETMPSATIHIYTLVIIICLVRFVKFFLFNLFDIYSFIVFQVLGVLLVILSSVDNITENDYPEVKTQRHFNKAMAMRSLRGLAQKHSRKKMLA